MTEKVNTNLPRSLDWKEKETDASYKVESKAAFGSTKYGAISSSFKWALPGLLPKPNGLSLTPKEGSESLLITLKL